MRAKHFLQLLLFFFSLPSWATTADDLVVEALTGANDSELSHFATRRGLSVNEFCQAIRQAQRLDRDAWLSLTIASVSFLEGQGLSPKMCTEINRENTVLTSRNSKPSNFTAAATSSWVVETYNIDLLKIETRVSPTSQTFCDEGSEVVIKLEGVIGPDSSFAMARLLDRLPRCLDQEGSLKAPPIAILRSGGGLLNDGYKLGNILREQQVKVVIENDTTCASSCAVAFLGGEKRIVQSTGQIMFHAPYFSGKNALGERDIDCNVGEESLVQLRDYYISMTDVETGERLYERTMWYCSENDGWVVTGGAAAELYGIATERQRKEKVASPQTRKPTAASAGRSSAEISKRQSRIAKQDSVRHLMPSGFFEGHVRLKDGFASGFQNGYVRSKVPGLITSGNFIELANSAAGTTPTGQNYYLLGRAAEAYEAYSAALTYYELALSMPTDCTNNRCAIGYSRSTAASAIRRVRGLM